MKKSRSTTKVAMDAYSILEAFGIPNDVCNRIKEFTIHGSAEKPFITLELVSIVMDEQKQDVQNILHTYKLVKKGK